MPAKLHEKRDVVIMGAGAAGALFAARLAKAGRSVVVLEGGPGWELGSLVSSQIWARRLKWGGAPVERAGKHPLGHNMAVGWGVGGSALHHYAGWPRLQPADFRMRSLYGRGLDWPFEYDELRPWYDRIQAEVGISGDVAKEVWRPAGEPYPMPPLKAFKHGELVARGFEKLGMRVAPAPMAVTSVDYKDRPACVYDGWCDAGCPILALANPFAVHLPLATGAGAEIRARSIVTRIETDLRGHAEALRYVDANGAEHVQPADTIVLAGAAVQNARLLLASPSTAHPNGFGNRNGLVGRYFNAHSITNAHGLFDEATECHMGLSAGTLTSQDAYEKKRDGPFGSITWGIGPALKPNDLLGIANTRPDLFGPALSAFLDKASKHLAVMNGIVESLPSRENRVELGSGKDRYGMPLARIVHSLDPETEKLWAFANAQGEAVMRAAGAREAWTSPIVALAHVAGGTIMGNDPAESVTNGYGQLHEAANVVIAGGGLFPTIGAVSPTFTVLAVAERTARRMLDHAADFRA
jgi:choline dehydrogenase-like flavoprotein